MTRKYFYNNRLRHAIPFAAASFTVGLALFACSDKDIDSNENNGKALVAFNVSEKQDEAQAAAKAAQPMTRAAFANQLALQDLAPEDLTMQKLPVQGMASQGLCLIETTVAGVPSQREDETPTRANITTMTTMQNFSTTAFYGSSDTSLEPWFYDKDTKKDGNLVTPIYWDWIKNHGCFYAVYPKPDNNKIKLSPASHTGTPYVDFEVEPNVTNQKDLMTACSGNVHTDIGTMSATAPRTDLTFRHALTAVRFKVGQNLSWNKTITKIEIVGAKSKARYTLPTTAGAAGTWGTPSAPATFTLSGLSFSTSDAVNNVIVGKGTDNGTFYMLPQTLTGAGVQVKVYFNGAATPAITATLTGQWKPGTTKTYALSQNTSDWSYVLNVVGPTAAVAYNQTAAGNYTIQSYRQSGGTLQPVKWKVVGYQESTDGGANWSALSTTKPAWLDALPVDHGDGKTSGTEGGAATVQTATLIDKLTPRNKALKEATPLGSASSYYDLSEHDYKGNPTSRNTANSYLISAPGYYKIPLVYGNAIKNGSTNTSSYQTSNSALFVLQHFIDHAGQPITAPWITQTNSGANAPDAAKLVWADESGIVEASSVAIEGSGTNAFVHFHVPADKIKNGNALIAVTKGGTVVWSWHLWFAPQDALETIACTNATNHVYKLTKENLGWKYTSWQSSSYTAPRKVKIKVEQEVTNNGTKQHGEIIITQNPGSGREGYCTLYEHGRKDAMPGTDALAEGSFIKNAGVLDIKTCIQYPNYYFGATMSYNVLNLWSMNATISDHTDNPVVKTIYDPCPAGFHMPAGNTFTGFSTTNVSGAWDNGWDFYNKPANPDATIYFPAAGWRENNDGGNMHVTDASIRYGCYWSAETVNPGSMPYVGWSMYFTQGGILTTESNHYRSYGFAVRPVADTKTKVTPKTPGSSVETWQEEELDGGSFKQH